MKLRIGFTPVHQHKKRTQIVIPIAFFMNIHGESELGWEGEGGREGIREDYIAGSWEI